MMRRMSLYQSIADELSKQLPEQWDTANVNLEMDSDLSVFEMWYEAGDNEEMIEISKGIGDAFKELWLSFDADEKGPWKKCTYILTPDGSFTTDFDYDSKLSWED